MSTDKNKLLLRAKDYDLLAIKNRKLFQVSLNDPLLNPRKKKNTRKIPIGFSDKPTPDKANPLARVSRMSKLPTKAAQAPLPVEASIALEEDAKPVETPWEAILQRFLKAYDYRPTQYEPKLTNVLKNQYRSSGVRA